MQLFKRAGVQTLVVIVIVFIGGFLALYYQSIISKQKSTELKTNPIVAQTIASSLTSQSSELESPDAKLKLIMKQESNKDGSKKYSLSVSDINGDNAHQVFTTVLSSGAMILPDNSWSPDNSYFFIQENDDKSENVLVFKSLGDNFADSQPYLNVNLLFAQKISDYSFYQATGWASPTLLILNTMKNQTEKGPSYWFEIPSQSFIQLAR